MARNINALAGEPGSARRRLVVGAGAATLVMAGLIAILALPPRATRPHTPPPAIGITPDSVAPAPSAVQGGETAPPGGPVIASQEDRGAAPGTPAADEPGTARDARSAATATGASPLPPSAAPPAEKPDETPPRSVLRIEPAPALPAGPASVADAAPTNVRPHASTAVSAPAPPKTVRRPTAVVARAPGAYLVEAGVFNNAASAEEMRAMLTLSGIPARVEARVTVGPFRNREEAETAQARIRTLGVVAPDLVPLRK